MNRNRNTTCALWVCTLVLAGLAFAFGNEMSALGGGAALAVFPFTLGLLMDSEPESAGGGAAVMSEGEFQGKVLGSLKKQQETTDSLVAKYDNLDKETKKAFEDLTKIKNANYVSDAEFLKAIQKLNLQLSRELKMANGDPIRRIMEDEEKRVRLNASVRHALSIPLTPEMKTGLGEDSSPGSTLIDDALASDIYDTLATYGVWNSFGVRRLGTKQTKFPVKTARAAAGYVLTEGGTISEDTAKAGTSVTLEVEVIAALLGVSKQLLDDSEFDVTADVLSDFAESVAYVMDWSCLQADGTADATDGGMTGIFAGGTAATAASGNTTMETLDFEDFTRALLTVDPIVLNRMARWWMHPQILVRCLHVKDLNGRPIFLTATEAPTAGGLGNILGYPVMPAFAAPTANTAGSKVAVFGDPNGLAVGVRSDFEFDGSDHAGWTTYERVFRGIARFGCKIRRATSFAVLTTAAS
ncbi:phage major capsid protein [Luteolibacter marinus]|uniref:phage major capsid protein n=1 Tax=Luteolibacter marinus TaxID=2776705 RepID=UPI0018691C43|nr:phage major capsid protein [Luteolibacter marinus]